jgi:hypothetical protein
MEDNKEQINKDMKALGEKLVPLTLRIMRLERCIGCKITLCVTNVMGMAQLSINAQTSGEGTLPEGLAEGLADAIAHEVGIPSDEEGDSESEQTPHQVAEDMLKNMLKKDDSDK